MTDTQKVEIEVELPIEWEIVRWGTMTQAEFDVGMKMLGARDVYDAQPGHRGLIVRKRVPADGPWQDTHKLGGPACLYSDLPAQTPYVCAGSNAWDWVGKADAVGALDPNSIVFPLRPKAKPEPTPSWEILRAMEKRVLGADFRKEMLALANRLHSEQAKWDEELARLVGELSARDSDIEGLNTCIRHLREDLATRDEEREELDKLRREFNARIYYQDIVYHVCNVLDRIDGKRVGGGLVCGTLETPTQEVQERMDKLLAKASALRGGA